MGSCELHAESSAAGTKKVTHGRDGSDILVAGAPPYRAGSQAKERTLQATLSIGGFHRTEETDADKSKERLERDRVFRSTRLHIRGETHPNRGWHLPSLWFGMPSTNMSR